MPKPWSWRTEREMLTLMIGSRFGLEPEKRIDEIRADRQNFAETVIAKRLKLEPTDVVLDLGSGCGFMAAPIASRVKHLYCADLSPDFADFCRQETQSLSNVTVMTIPFADLRQLDGLGITKAFAHAVFIHFSLFDAVAYFRELALILPPGGLLLIDANDLDRINTTTDQDFNRHLQYYKSNRNNIFDLMQWHSLPAYERVAAAEGFSLVESAPSKNAAFTQLLFRRSEPR
ncbi:MAG TPA: methyltransferase domain-containing protein [Alphaproteobacteria bacterium]|jgi:cyclopropane fatty-acyl-phospholipid synthase-like methyltransferase|nr:methyltransferase domain-containing protein [Alphaproteobacteria bacterium]